MLNCCTIPELALFVQDAGDCSLATMLREQFIGQFADDGHGISVVRRNVRGVTPAPDAKDRLAATRHGLAVVPDRAPRAQTLHGRFRRGDEVREVLIVRAPHVAAGAPDVGAVIGNQVRHGTVDAICGVEINHVVAVQVHGGITEDAGEPIPVN